MTVEQPWPMTQRPNGALVAVSALPDVRSSELHSVSLFDELAFPTAFSESSWVEPLERIRAYYAKEIGCGAYSDAQYRTYKMMKAKLPALMPAGEFSARRDDALLRSSGFMQFDIDAKDNPGRDLDAVKWMLAEMEQVAYVVLSVSGVGLWGLVRISHPQDFHSQGRRLLLHLRHHTRAIYDEPVTLRKSGLRLFSYDERAWINPNATAFNLLSEAERPRFSRRRPGPSHDRKVIENLLERVEAEQVDITVQYADWVRVMFALSTAFGPDGLQYAQRLSQFYPGYDAREVERQYFNIDASRRHPVPLKEVQRIAETHWKCPTKANA